LGSKFLAYSLHFSNIHVYVLLSILFNWPTFLEIIRPGHEKGTVELIFYKPQIFLTFNQQSKHWQNDDLSKDCMSEKLLV